MRSIYLAIGLLASVAWAEPTTSTTSSTSTTTMLDARQRYQAERMLWGRDHPKEPLTDEMAKEMQHRALTQPPTAEQKAILEEFWASQRKQRERELPQRQRERRGEP